MAALISLLNKQKQSDEEEETPKSEEPAPEDTSYDAETPHPTTPEVANTSPGSGKAPSKDGGKPHPIYVSETTTENTTVNVVNGNLKDLKNLNQPIERTTDIGFP